MNALLVVEDPGLGVTAQDLGRPGFRRLGVPLSGALDPVLLAAAQALAKAPENSAGLEILLTGPILRAEASVRLGLAGDVDILVTRADGAQQNFDGWRSLILQPGDRAAIRLRRAPAYVCFSGGLLSPPTLGSRSCYPRAGLPGLAGRPLARGDILPCATEEGEALQGPPFQHGDGPIRFIAGPQATRFDASAMPDFCGADWRVTADFDRMGMRLAGLPLQHGPEGAGIVSDGVTPGAIQVPGDGQPIVLLKDCQTSGGYAKIGCVIAADLPRLAHARSGDKLRFQQVELAEAAAALSKLRQHFKLWRHSLHPAEEGLDATKLWTENLISGATNGG
jgi:allophanate hydrolase